MVEGGRSCVLLVLDGTLQESVSILEGFLSKVIDALRNELEDGG
jgi:hypothetical protein